MLENRRIGLDELGINKQINECKINYKISKSQYRI